jgi:hypothetical protein
LPCREHKINPEVDQLFLDKLVLANLNKIRNSRVVGSYTITNTEVVVVVCFAIYVVEGA